MLFRQIIKGSTLFGSVYCSAGFLKPKHADGIGTQQNGLQERKEDSFPLENLPMDNLSTEPSFLKVSVTSSRLLNSKTTRCARLYARDCHQCVKDPSCSYATLNPNSKSETATQDIFLPGCINRYSSSWFSVIADTVQYLETQDVLQKLNPVYKAQDCPKSESNRIFAKPSRKIIRYVKVLITTKLYKLISDKLSPLNDEFERRMFTLSENLIKNGSHEPTARSSHMLDNLGTSQDVECASRYGNNCPFCLLDSRCSYLFWNGPVSGSDSRVPGLCVGTGPLNVSAVPEDAQLIMRETFPHLSMLTVRKLRSSESVHWEELYLPPIGSDGHQEKHRSLNENEISLLCDLLPYRVDSPPPGFHVVRFQFVSLIVITLFIIYISLSVRRSIGYETIANIKFALTGEPTETT